MPELGDALQTAAKALLEMRSDQARTRVAAAVGRAATTGMHNSGRFPLAIAAEIQAEAQECGSIVGREVESFLSVAPPVEVLASELTLRPGVDRLLRTHLDQLVSETEQHALRRVREQNPVGMAAFDDQCARARDAARAIADAAVSRMMAAARSSAAKGAGGPTITATFYGPSAGVNIGGAASFGAIGQTISAPTPAEVADAVAALLEALRASGTATEAPQAEEALAAAEPELRAGRLPFGAVMRGLELIGRVGDLVTKAPAVIEAAARLRVMLGLG